MSALYASSKENCLCMLKDMTSKFYKFELELYYWAVLWSLENFHSRAPEELKNLSVRECAMQAASISEYDAHLYYYDFHKDNYRNLRILLVDRDYDC